MNEVFPTRVGVHGMSVQNEPPPALGVSQVASQSASLVNTLFAPAPVVILIAGISTVPVNVGEASGAFSASSSSIAVCTVVAAIVPDGLKVTAEAVVDVVPAAIGSDDTVR